MDLVPLKNLRVIVFAVLWITVGLCFSARAQTEPGKAGADSIQQAVQTNIDGLSKKGFAMLQSGNWIEANRIFEEILTMTRSDSLTFYGNALALFNLKKTSDAAINVGNAVEILSRNRQNDRLLTDSLVLSAVISATMNKNDEAIITLKRATEISPDHFDANLSLGRAYFGNGDTAAAVGAFRQAVAVQPSDLRARFFLATSLERAGSLEDALREYRAVVALNGEYAEGNLGLGVLLLKIEGDGSAEGIRALKKAIALNGNLYEARISLGKCLNRLGRAAEALEHLQRAAELAPNNPEPHYQLALAYRKIGKTKEAAAEMQIVKEIHEARRGVPGNK